MKETVMIHKGGDKMRWGSTIVLSGFAVGTILALAGCVTTNPNNPARNAAVARCNDRAAREVRASGSNVMQQRYFIYIDCMHQAGFEP